VAIADATVIRDACVVLSDGIAEGCDVRFEDGFVAEIGNGLSLRGAREFPAAGAYLAPGFFDMHLHGMSGAMFEDASEKSVRTILEALPRYGVTSVLATIAALPPQRTRAAVESIARVAATATGARVAGIHLEGPFLNPLYAGAQNPAWFRAPNVDEIDALQTACGGRIRLITVAPEIAGAPEAIGALRRRGITVALGHSAADETTATATFALGARQVTHLFNAMRGLHHRSPGIAGAALTEDSVVVEVICDGHHLARRMLEIVWRCKPRDRVALVSDAVAAAGLAEGEIDLFGQKCVIAAGSVRLAKGGVLAGSCLTLDRAVHNVVTWFPAISIAEALAMASRVPARAVGLGEEVGELALGRRADAVLLGEQLDVLATWADGRMLWRAE
jgi:N-acetylglucosamine-6-phosphate deacetylase